MNKKFCTEYACVNSRITRFSLLTGLHVNENNCLEITLLLLLIEYIYFIPSSGSPSGSHLCGKYFCVAAAVGPRRGCFLRRNTCYFIFLLLFTLQIVRATVSSVFLSGI